MLSQRAERRAPIGLLFVIVVAVVSLVACQKGVGVGQVPPTPTPTSPPSLTGQWSLTVSNYTLISCTSTLPGVCSSGTGTTSSGTSQVTIHQSGTQLVVNFAQDSSAGLQPDLSGTITGSKVVFGATYKGPDGSVNSTTEAVESSSYTGTVLSPNQMNGAFNVSFSDNGTESGVQFSVMYQARGNWTATRTTH